MLVVDDNRDAAESLALLLGRSATRSARSRTTDCEALEVAGARSARRGAARHRDAGLDGYEAARRIREQPWGKDMLLVALTGWGQDDDRRRSQDAGFDHHLVKPVDPEVVAKLISSLPTN